MNTHPLVELADEYATGNERVDAAFESLMEALHCIRDTLMTTPKSPKVRQALQVLFQRAPTHFLEEEAAMRASAYPKLAAHAESHAVLLRRLQQIEEAVGKRDTVPELVLYGLCSDWISGHQTVHDLEMAEHLRAREGGDTDSARQRDTKPGVAVVLDESETMRIVYGKMLAPYTRKGLRVLYGENGKEGLDHLRQQQGAAVVITNWDMPVMDGMDLLRTVRKEEPLRATPVVLVGIYSDEGSHKKALEEGATAYIVKHLVTYELPHLLARLMPGKE